MRRLGKSATSEALQITRIARKVADLQALCCAFRAGAGDADFSCFATHRMLSFGGVAPAMPEAWVIESGETQVQECSQSREHRGVQRHSSMP